MTPIQVTERRLSIDLRRLLHRMKTYNPDELSSHDLRGRVRMANEMLNELERLEFPGVEMLRDQVNSACQTSEELAKKKTEKEIDFVEMIFFEPHRQFEKEEGTDDDEKEVIQPEIITSSQEQKDGAPIKETLEDEMESSIHETSFSQNEEVPVIQKAQQEQLQAEISRMASQLKASTQFMNNTLRGQRENLEKMEDLASENVDNVTKAADNVQQHNKRAWSSTIATWTLFMIVVATFIFCMMIIRIVPKRANAQLPCLFNCEEVRTNDMNRFMEQQKNLSLQQRRMVSETEENDNMKERKDWKEQNHYSTVSKLKTSKDKQSIRSTEDERIGNAEECLAESQEQISFTAEQTRVTAKRGMEHPENWSTQQQKIEPDMEKSENMKGHKYRRKQNHHSAASQLEASESKECIGSSAGQHLCNSEECPAEIQEQISFTAEQIRIAAKRNELKDLRYYLQQAPWLVSESDENGWGAIHEAVRGEHTEAVDLLLQHTHVDVNAKTNIGATPLWLAQNFGPTHPIFISLKRAGGILLGPEGSAKASKLPNFTSNDVLKAAAYGDDELLTQILEQNPEWVNVVDENGWSPLHEAVRGEHTSTVDLLIKREISVNIVTSKNNGWTPLGIAMHLFGEDHSITKQLSKSGGKDIRSNNI